VNPGFYNVVFYATAAVLVSAVVALEISRLRGGKKGRLVRLLCAGEAFGLGEGRAEVKLADGRVVEALVPGCTQCLCRLRPGDAVVLTKTAAGYVVGPGA